MRHLRILARVHADRAMDGSISRALGGGLHVWYELVVGRTPPAPLQMQHLVRHELSLDQVAALAETSLWEKVTSVSCHRDNDRAPMRLFVNGAAAVQTLVMRDLWESLRDDVDGDLVVAIKDDGAVFFAGSRERHAFTQLIALNRHTSLLRWTERGWKRYGTPRVMRRAA